MPSQPIPFRMLLGRGKGRLKLRAGLTAAFGLAVDPEIGQNIFKHERLRNFGETQPQV